MKLLLDTHVFPWYTTGDARLPAAWEAVLRNTANSVFLSVVSMWEASIKYHPGRLPLPAPPGAYLPEQRRRHSIASLPLTEDGRPLTRVCQPRSGLIRPTTVSAAAKRPRRDGDETSRSGETSHQAAR